MYILYMHAYILCGKQSLSRYSTACRKFWYHPHFHMSFKADICLLKFKFYWLRFWYICKCVPPSVFHINNFSQYLWNCMLYWFFRYYQSTYKNRFRFKVRIKLQKSTAINNSAESITLNNVSVYLLTSRIVRTPV